MKSKNNKNKSNTKTNSNNKLKVSANSTNISNNANTNTNASSKKLNLNINNSINVSNFSTTNTSNINYNADTNNVKNLNSFNNNINISEFKSFGVDLFGNTTVLRPINNYKNEEDAFDYNSLVLKETHNYNESENNYFFEQLAKISSVIDPNYFQRQANLNPWMRTVLLDWMMDLCTQLNFKRATFHLATLIVDISLSKIFNLPSKFLQLIGVTSLCIAAKSEEICSPTIKMYSYSTGEAYDSKQIIECEQFLLQNMQWKVNYPTLTTWANIITLKWDNWLKTKLDTDERFRKLPFFRHNMVSSYLFDRFFFCLDICVLHECYLQYESHKFICALIYVIMGMFSGYIPSEVLFDISRGNKDLAALDEFYILNNSIDMFLIESMDICLQEIAQYIPISCHYLCITGFHKDVRPIKFDSTKSTLEEFLQTQTHSSEIMKVMEFLRNGNNNTNINDNINNNIKDK